VRRREFIGLLGGGAAAVWPLLGRAQAPTKLPLIGWLSGVGRERSLHPVFLQGLRDLNYIEGRDFEIEYRFADGYMDRSPALAEELLKLRPDVLFAATTPVAVAIKALTQTAPIVCPLLADPIRFGLIASQARPGGNVTGLLFRIDGLAGKQLEFGLRLIPDARTVGVLVNLAGGTIIDRAEVAQAARELGLKLVPAEVRSPTDIEPAFQLLANAKVQVAIMLVDAMFFNERQRIAALAADTRLPVIYGFRDHVDAGGLISYGVNLAANFRRAASYVVKILKGTKPDELPVEFPTKLELVINLKAANALGLEIPPILLGTADEVID
jgi:putative ABC transport system substrate-binding protein